MLSQARFQFSDCSTTNLLLATGDPALFIFSTIDGTIAGWNPAVGLPPGGTGTSTNAVTVVKTTDGSSYTGLTSATLNGKTYSMPPTSPRAASMSTTPAFNASTLGQSPVAAFPIPALTFLFSDVFLPRNFVPFNVQAVGNDIVVTTFWATQGLYGAIFMSMFAFAAQTIGLALYLTAFGHRP